MDESDLGSDEEWVPGGEVEVDNNYANDDTDKSMAEAKLSALFGAPKRESDASNTGVLNQSLRSNRGQAPSREDAGSTGTNQTDNYAPATPAVMISLDSTQKQSADVTPSQSFSGASGKIHTMPSEKSRPDDAIFNGSIRTYVRPESSSEDERRPEGRADEALHSTFSRVRAKMEAAIISGDDSEGNPGTPGGPISAVSTDESPASPPPPNPPSAAFGGKSYGKGVTRVSMSDLSSTYDATRGGVVFEVSRPRTADSSGAQLSSLNLDSNMLDSLRHGSTRDEDMSGGSFSSRPQTAGVTDATKYLNSASNISMPPSPYVNDQLTPQPDSGYVMSTPEPLKPPVGEDRARSDSIRGADGLSTLPGLVNRGKIGSTRSHKDLPTVKYRSGSLRSDASQDSDGKSSNKSFSAGPVGHRSDSAGSVDFSEDHENDDRDHEELERMSSEGSLNLTAEATNLLQMTQGSASTPQSGMSQTQTMEMRLCSAVPDKSVLDCIVDLLKGTRAQKQKALKRFGQRWIWLGDDLATLLWKSKRQEFGKLSLTDVSRLRTEQRELHIENVAGRKVVLILGSREEARLWLTGLSCLVPKRCRVKMDGEFLKDRLTYDPLRDTWRGNIVAQQKKVEDYILLGNLDRGYLALSTADKRFFSVKTVESSRTSPDARRMAILLKLTHRNVVRHRDTLWDEQKHTAIYVEEYMARGVVFECRANTDPRPLAEDGVLEIMRDVVRGLDYLHTNGITHGSLQPDYLYRAGDGSVKISGLTPTDEPDWTMGAFTAPEVEAGTCTYPHFADVWSLGATIFFMVTGKVPFPGASREEIARAKISSKIKYPREPKLSRKLKDLLDRALLREPTKRISLQDVLRHGWFRERIQQKFQNNIYLNTVEIESAVRPTVW